MARRWRQRVDVVGKLCSEGKLAKVREACVGWPALPPLHSVSSFSKCPRPSEASVLGDRVLGGIVMNVS